MTETKSKVYSNQNEWKVKMSSSRQERDIFNIFTNLFLINKRKNKDTYNYNIYTKER